MMIEVTKVGDLVFEVRFAEQMREEITCLGGWGTSESALHRILCDMLLGGAADVDGFDDGLYIDPFFEAADDDDAAS
ncbi:hypothetical protein K7W03_25775 [Sphingobium sp. PNB]|uniref:hypothetical protein n=1 Tax=Sphingobium sp. PNB TaxID=863934 RepID=UPI001CA3C742|nr:hypothetical protein [Sphingobium sp. PNB]MCB4862995.1 hypothetical protein [Sphingobium sp. PNB]